MTSGSHLILSSAVSAFFSASCVPGAAGMATALCALCQGEKSYIRHRNYHCETSHSEPFYNSQGALRSDGRGITGEPKILPVVLHATPVNVDHIIANISGILLTVGKEQSVPTKTSESFLDV